jgi:hypothetical protein
MVDHPYDTPVILLENRGQLICKRMLLGANDLAQVFYAFPEDIYAVNPQENRAAGKQGIYELEYNNLIAKTPRPDVDILFFDRTGVLYMMVNEKSGLYYTPID